MQERQENMQALRIFGSTQRYVQGPNAIDAIGTLVAPLGSSVVLIIDAFMSSMLSERILSACAASGLSLQIIEVSDEVTHANITARANAVDASGRNVIIVGVGGGKAIDLARAVSWRLDAPFVSVPTIASNDSPAAMAVAVYNDDHSLAEVIQTGRNPNMVLVDTNIIVAAPPRFLSAGIGDALAKKFEADACNSSGGLNQYGTRPFRISRAIADECYSTLRECAERGLQAAARHEVDEWLEATVEASILMSGLAFENGGLSIAHSMMRGLQVVRGAREALHGEHVAYGLLVQRALEGASDEELLDLAKFLSAVGLPKSLSCLGLVDPEPFEIEALISGCLSSPHRAKTTSVVSAATLTTAIGRIEVLSAIV